MESISLRPATPSDIPRMLTIFFSAFSTSPLNIRCFPPSDPSSAVYMTTWINNNIDVPDTHLLLAVSSSEILGWARWVRRPTTSSTTTVKISPSVFPATGDQECAAEFFQGNVDATSRIVNVQEYWFLSTIVTAPEAQRRGVGSALMRFGVDKADEEGWMSYLNASADGKALYERFNFVVVDSTSFGELGMTQYHMKRDPKSGKGVQ